MSTTTITYDDLDTTATFINGQRSDILVMLQETQRRVAALTAGGFQTQTASNQFQVSYDDLNKGINDAVGALEGMATFLTEAAKTYREVDEGLAAGIRG